MLKVNSVSLSMIGEYPANDERLVGAVCQNLGWRFSTAGDYAASLQSTRSNLPQVVIAQADRAACNWKSVLREIQGLEYPPNLVVTSPMADDRLWAEVLNLGGYDVLAQPLDRDEVERVITSAARHIHWPRRTRKHQTQDSVPYTATSSARVAATGTTPVETVGTAALLANRQFLKSSISPSRRG